MTSCTEGIIYLLLTILLFLAGIPPPQPKLDAAVLPATVTNPSGIYGGSLLCLGWHGTQTENVFLPKKGKDSDCKSPPKKRLEIVVPQVVFL